MKKALKVAMLFGLILVAILASGIAIAEKKPVPEYVGSQACMACHADRWSSWAGSGHGTMIQPIKTPGDIPGFDKANAEQTAELLKADYVVSGARFLARDKETGNMVFLKYEWMQDQSQYIDYDEPGSIWQNQCMGCHVTGSPKAGVANQPTEFGIGCEDCHGPGKDHVIGKGDPTKITLNVGSDVCGQCHNSGYKMQDGNRWVYGYRPAMKLADLPGIMLPKATDPAATANLGHHKEFPEWQVSGHGPKAVSDLKANSHATGECYACHTQEAYSAKEGNREFTYDANADYVGISCVTCHRPHGLGLAADEKELCISCHTGDIAKGTSLKPGSAPHHPMKEFFEGYGAAGGLTSDSNFHKDVACQACHMPNNNHLMQVISPDDPNLAEGSNDSCTACHKDSTRDARGGYLKMWQDVTSTELTALNADVATIEAAVKDGATLTADQKLKLDTAKTNIAFVTADGSTGAHNFDYATQILSAAQKDLSAVKKAIGR
jgi:predicted CXXCH cytochrome family protein